MASVSTVVGVAGWKVVSRVSVMESLVEMDVGAVTWEAGGGGGEGPLYINR